KVIEPEGLGGLETDVEVAAPAVDQDEGGEDGAFLEGLAEAAAEDLLEGGKVVGALDGPDPEALVIVRLHRAVFPDDHRADLLATLGVGDVVALDTVRGRGEAEDALQLFEHELLTVAPGQEVALQRDVGILCGPRHD